MSIPMIDGQMKNLNDRIDFLHHKAECLNMERISQENEITRLTKQRDELVAALEKLSRLGNGDQYGNSIGNQIAIEALAKVKEQK